MQELVESIVAYVHQTRALEALATSTETSFYPDLKALLTAVLKNERLPFEVITGTSEGGAPLYSSTRVGLLQMQTDVNSLSDLLWPFVSSDGIGFLQANGQLDLVI